MAYIPGGRLTAPFSGRPLRFQHAGAQDLFMHNLTSPAAKHFIDPGPLQRFVRRRVELRVSRLDLVCVHERSFTRIVHIGVSRNVRSGGGCNELI
jgi:hypothetical protein